jgi:hypothetical protein
MKPQKYHKATETQRTQRIFLAFLRAPSVPLCLCGEVFSGAGFGQSMSEVRIRQPFQSLETIGSFVFSELKAKGYASTFNKLLQWSERFQKKSVKMGLGWVLHKKKQKSPKFRRQKCVSIKQ